MTLADTLKQQALARTGDVPGDSLASLRSAALATLQQLPFPDRKTERWKYTSLSALEAGHLSQHANGTGEHLLPDFAATKIVIRNGKIEALPELASGISVRPIEADDVSVSDQNIFDAYNAATLTSGLVIDVAAGHQADTSLHLIFITDATSPASASARLRVNLGAGSNLTLIEHYVGSGPALCSAVIAMDVGANASLTHYRLQAEAADSLHISSTEMIQRRDSRVRSYQLMTGNTLRRNDMRVWMQEPGADLVMRGVYLARHNSHIDNQVCIEHATPHCTSDQVFKGIAGETARAVFNGRIHIHPGARGTDAQLANNNLLLSNQAEIDSKPELEIYNDDVKCAHGTTVGQMDHQQVFYLRSRGISEAAAKRMLGVGFINELLLALPDEAIAEWARNWLAGSL